MKLLVNFLIFSLMLGVNLWLLSEAPNSAGRHGSASPSRRKRPDGGLPQLSKGATAPKRKQHDKELAPPLQWTVAFQKTLNASLKNGMSLTFGLFKGIREVGVKRITFLLVRERLPDGLEENLKGYRRVASRAGLTFQLLCIREHDRVQENSLVVGVGGMVEFLHGRFVGKSLIALLDYDNKGEELKLRKSNGCCLFRWFL